MKWSSRKWRKNFWAVYVLPWGNFFWNWQRNSFIFIFFDI